ncbi:hypothetical protein PACTADRAFT_77734 [Pachysolen tannophilus NRRL Y-2460]|uniref:Altered inheritance of mitochondria protein 21 n=1 Tax=Pachysolen tannophilus NRRL Y-2460 TaxID=669874 RepID=A0A1E4TNR4_PACTA|nr:hypothetical protein PACTADRAFT_77734 [Pachysolen tannophilus NRRL Y-2460]
MQDIPAIPRRPKTNTASSSNSDIPQIPSNRPNRKPTFSEAEKDNDNDGADTSEEEMASSIPDGSGSSKLYGKDDAVEDMTVEKETETDPLSIEGESVVKEEDASPIPIIPKRPKTHIKESIETHNDDQSDDLSLKQTLDQGEDNVLVEREPHNEAKGSFDTVTSIASPLSATSATSATSAASAASATSPSLPTIPKRRPVRGRSENIDNGTITPSGNISAPDTASTPENYAPRNESKSAVFASDSSELLDASAALDLAQGDKEEHEEFVHEEVSLPAEGEVEAELETCSADLAPQLSSSSVSSSSSSPAIEKLTDSSIPHIPQRPAHRPLKKSLTGTSLDSGSSSPATSTATITTVATTKENSDNDSSEIPKLKKSETIDSETSSSLTTKKIPPPIKPKKPSSKILAFQQMLAQQQQEDAARSGRRPPPLVTRKSLSQTSSKEDDNSKESPEIEEKSGNNEEISIDHKNKPEIPRHRPTNKFTGNKAAFAKNLNGVFAGGIALPGMVLPGMDPPAALSSRSKADDDNEDDDDDEDDDNSNNRSDKKAARKVTDVRRGRAKGPRGRKLPSSVQDPVIVEEQKYKVFISDCWQIGFLEKNEAAITAEATAEKQTNVDDEKQKEDVGENNEEDEEALKVSGAKNSSQISLSGETSKFINRLNAEKSNDNDKDNIGTTDSIGNDNESEAKMQERENLDVSTNTVNSSQPEEEYVDADPKSDLISENFENDNEEAEAKKIPVTEEEAIAELLDDYGNNSDGEVEKDNA